MAHSHPIKIVRRLIPLWTILAGMCAPYYLKAEVSPPSIQAALPEVAPLPAVTTFALAHGIPITEIELAPDGEGLRAGDSVTLLIALYTGQRYSQWLAIMQADKLSVSEKHRRPPIGDVVRYTTTGNELHYHITASTALKVRFIGPFFDDSTASTSSVPGEQNERILVSPEFLGLGLDQTCRIWVRLQDNLKQLRAAGGDRDDLFLPLESSTARFPDSVVAKTRIAAAKIGFTLDDERPFYGMELALEDFGRIIASSPAADKMFKEVAEKPSLWSTFSHLGIEGNVTTSPQDIRLIDSSSWRVALQAYRLPFQLSLNGQAALDGVLVVTAPRPPLLACAGVLGISAAAPHDPSKHLLIRVVAAHHGSGDPIESSARVAP